MDNPSVLPGIPVDHIEREHREHKLSLDGFKQLQELLHILFVECILIVSAIGVHIRRIDEMKGIKGSLAVDHVESVSVLNSHSFEPLTKPLCELILRVTQFLGHCAAEVISKCPVHH